MISSPLLFILHVLSPHLAGSKFYDLSPHTTFIYLSIVDFALNRESLLTTGVLDPSLYHAVPDLFLSCYMSFRSGSCSCSSSSSSFDRIYQSVSLSCRTVSFFLSLRVVAILSMFVFNRIYLSISLSCRTGSFPRSFRAIPIVLFFLLFFVLLLVLVLLPVWLLLLWIVALIFNGFERNSVPVVPNEIMPFKYNELRLNKASRSSQYRHEEVCKRNKPKM